jgi:hypothetical protein
LWNRAVAAPDVALRLARRRSLAQAVQAPVVQEQLACHHREVHLRPEPLEPLEEEELQLLAERAVAAEEPRLQVFRALLLAARAADSDARPASCT